jgi:hypothetical protein
MSKILPVGCIFYVHDREFFKKRVGGDFALLKKKS